MIYLTIAIICGSMFSILFKLYQQHGINVPQTIFFNYITASIFSWVPIVFDMAQSGGTTTAEYILPFPTLFLSLFQGILFMTGFMVMDRSTFRCGVALTTVAARASLVMPVIFSWILLSQPAPSWLPIILVLIAMMMIILPNQQQTHEGIENRSKSNTVRQRKAAFSLLGVFLFYGVSDFSLKLVQHTTESSTSADKQLSALMGMIFVMAAITSLITCIVRGSFKEQRIGWKTIGGGILLGLVNMTCTSCMLRGLGALPTGLYYPLYNIGIVIIATLIGVFFFKERIKPLQILGLIIAVTAIALFFN